MEWLDPQELVLGWGWILLDAESLVTQKWKHEAEGENSLIRPPMSYRVLGMGRVQETWSLNNPTSITAPMILTSLPWAQMSLFLEPQSPYL